MNDKFVVNVGGFVSRSEFEEQVTDAVFTILSNCFLHGDTEEMEVMLKPLMSIHSAMKLDMPVDSIDERFKEELLKRQNQK